MASQPRIVWVLALAATTCLSPVVFDGHLGSVVVADGGGNDAGNEDSDLPDAGDGGFVARLSFPIDRTQAFSTWPTALGANGDVAGYGDGLARESGVFLATDAGVVWRETVNGSWIQIRSLGENHAACGEADWTDPQFGGHGGTAVAGTFDDFTRLLPDPVTSDCRDGNRAGVYIGQWKAQGYIREADGGVIRMDFFAYPAPDTRFIFVDTAAINERGDVVGNVQYGDQFGRGNPAGLVRFADGGLRLLDNGPRPAKPTDINDTGVVVGFGRDYDFEQRAIVWPDPMDAGVFLPLPDGMIEAQATAINNAGLIVGFAYDEGYGAHGVLWWHGRAWLADTLVAGQTELPVEYLLLVNDMPRIAGVLREEVIGDDGGVQQVQRWAVAIDILHFAEAPDGG